MKQHQPKTDDAMRGLIHSFLASLIGTEDHMGEIQNGLYWGNLPEDMPFERDLMQVLERCSTNSIPPTRENVIHGLQTMFTTHKVVDNQLDSIIEKLTEHRMVTSQANWIMEDVMRRKGEDAFARGTFIMKLGEGSVADRLYEAVNEVAQVASTGDDTSVVLNQGEFLQFGANVMRQRAADRKSGRKPGAGLKFTGFVNGYDKDGKLTVEGKAPYLPFGRTTLITAKSKYGKTMLGGVLAEHNAWDLGHDVLYLYLETEPESMFDRMVSRHTYIPTSYLGAGLLDPDDSKNDVSKAFNDFIAFANSPEKNVDGKRISSGEITFHYCAGYDVFKINAAIRLARRRSDERGRGLVVFVDYYNLIDKSAFMSKGLRESSALGQVAYHLREGVKKENRNSKAKGGVGVHCFVFAQESGEDDKSYAYGSREIVQYSQLHISFQRETAQSDIPLTRTDRDGKQYQVKDPLGNLCFWQRTGGMAAEATLDIIVGNEQQKGKVKVMVDNYHYDISSTKQVAASV